MNTSLTYKSDHSRDHNEPHTFQEFVDIERHESGREYHGVISDAHYIGAAALKFLGSLAHDVLKKVS